MAMPASYCTPGAEVEKVLDYVSHEDVESNGGKMRQYKWKPSNPRRRGFIVEVEYPGDGAFQNDTVQSVLCLFQAGKPPERVLPTQLNLVKVANESALYALKNNVAIQKANNGLIDDIKKPLAVDQTGVGKTKPGKGLSKGEAEDLIAK